MGRSPVGSIRVLPRLFLVRRGFPAAGRKISAALCTTMEEMAGEEAALIGYRDGAAGESAAAMVLWSPAAWTEAGETGRGLRRHGSDPLQYNSKLKVNHGSC